MKKYIGVIACLLILCTTCTGCGLALFGGLTFNSVSEVEAVESIVFPDADLGRDEQGDDTTAAMPEGQSRPCDGEEGREEIDPPVTVDSGLTVIEVTIQNLYQVYNKYGIETTGVIIIESNNTDELEFGDRVTAVNGIAISTADEMNNVIYACKPGDVISVSVERDDSILTFEITLNERTPDLVDFG